MILYFGSVPNWDVSDVKNMGEMFFSASSFDQSLGSWDISSVEDMTHMLNNCGMSTENYDKTLIGWNTGEYRDIALGFNDLTYCKGDDARANLIIKGWTIRGDENICPPFVTTWNTNYPGTSDSFSITIPTHPDYSYSYKVDWNNDGVYEQTAITGDITHRYEKPGKYTIKIKGTFPAIYFNNSGDKEKLLSVDHWGNNQWKTFSDAFYGASNMIFETDELPDLSQVTSMSNMFRDAEKFNGYMQEWNVSKLENMSGAFAGAESFNQDIGQWDVSNVNDMSEMFRDAISFNRNISGWNVAKTESMKGMFTGAISFNQELKQWDVSDVTDISGMFQGSRSFNRDLNNWDVSNVTDMSIMFQGATDFQGDLSGWNVTKVKDMSGMFQGSRSFNRDLNNWDVSNVTDMSVMFGGANEFNGDLSGWDVSNVIDMSGMFATALSFNGDIGDWNVSNVTDMSNVFSWAVSFNQDISRWDVSNVLSMDETFFGGLVFNQKLENWDVSNVTNMSRMFASAHSFNQDVGNWDVSNVDSMQGMFWGTYSFNQDIERWNVSNVTDMNKMFAGATDFDSDLSGWDISNVEDMTGMLGQSGITTGTYDQILIGWSEQGVSNIELGARDLTYCDGDSARNNLIENLGWTINGDDKVCSPFITTWKTDNEGVSNSSSITIPVPPSDFSYNYDVDWDNDGTYDEIGIKGEITHDFGKPGVYTIRIRGNFHRISFNNSGDKDKIISIDQWGDIQWRYFGGAFHGASNLKSMAFDVPDLSRVRSTYKMFAEAITFNADLSGWDISNINDMNHMLDNSGLSTENYDKTLIGWNEQGYMDVDIGAAGLTYCKSKDARSELINKGWTINGDSFFCTNSCEFIADAGEDKSYCSEEDDVEVCAVEQADVKYSWVKGATAMEGRCVELNEGQWVLYVADNEGCRATDTINIFRSTPIEVKLSEDSTVSISGGTAPYDIVFSDDDGSLKVVVTDTNGCTGQDNLITTSSDHVFSSSVNIFPNPVHDFLTIKVKGYDSYDVILFDQYGRKIIHRKNAMELDVSSFEAGIYYLQVFPKISGVEVHHFPVVIIR